MSMCSFKEFILCTASGTLTEDTQIVFGVNELVEKYLNKSQEWSVVKFSIGTSNDFLLYVKAYNFKSIILIKIKYNLCYMSTLKSDCV